jgi:hypothetical protein
LARICFGTKYSAGILSAAWREGLAAPMRKNTLPMSRPLIIFFLLSFFDRPFILARMQAFPIREGKGLNKIHEI